MIPTLDFSNIIRKIVQASGAVFLNPVTWSVALAVATGVFITGFLDYVDALAWWSVDVTVYLPENEWIQFFGYVLSLDVPVDIIQFFLYYLPGIVIFFSTSIPTFCAALFAFRKMSIIRKAWEGLTK